MKRTILMTLISLMGLASAQAEDQVLCITTPTVSIYDRTISKVIILGRQYETVVPFQGFGQEELVPSNVSSSLQDYFDLSKRYTQMRDLFLPTLPRSSYLRVELTDREEEDADNNVGWVEKSLIKPKSKCAGYKEPEISADDDLQIVGYDVQFTTLPTINGISADCCLFPMRKHPTHSMNEGMRRFGAGRSKNRRLHAAADLYQTQYQPVYAVARGKVLRDRVPFYLGTNVTEIEHPGGFIARYGEMASNGIKPLKLGKTVKAGQLIGYIKKVNSRNVKNPMLHFELYTGKASGPLTVEKRGNKYQRRSDLINPTKYLAQWEKRLK